MFNAMFSASETHVPSTSPGPEARPLLADGFQPGFVFDGRYIVLDFERYESHACLYAIGRLDSDGSESETGYAARVYDLKGLSSRYLKYRTRSMKRLANRAIWKGKVEDLHVIVFEKDSLDYATDQGPDITLNQEAQTRLTGGKKPGQSLTQSMKSLTLESAEQERSNLHPSGKRSDASAGPCFKRLSTTQQESRRLRQRDRRVKRSRASANQAEASSPELLEPISALLALQFNLEEDYSSFTTYVYRKNQNLKARIPTLGAVQAPAETERVEIISDTGNFVDAKDREIVFLQRGLQKLAAMISRLRCGKVELEPGHGPSPDFQPNKAQQSPSSLLEVKIRGLEDTRVSLTDQFNEAKRVRAALRQRVNSEREEWVPLAAFLVEAQTRIPAMKYASRVATFSENPSSHHSRMFRTQQAGFVAYMDKTKDCIKLELHKALRDSHLEEGTIETRVQGLKAQLELLDLFRTMGMEEGRL